MSWIVDLQVEVEGSKLKVGCRRTREPVQVGSFRDNDAVSIDLDDVSADIRADLEKALLLPGPVPKP